MTMSIFSFSRVPLLAAACLASPLLRAQLVVPGVEWETTVGGLYEDRGGRDVRETSEGDFIFAGTTYNADHEFAGNVWLVRVHSRGFVLRERAINVSLSDGALAMKGIEDRELILTGWTGGDGPCGLDFCGSTSDVLLLKADEDGRVIWRKVYGGERDDAGRSVIATRDGGFLVAGHTLSQGAGNRDYYLLKTDSDGDLEWERTYGGKVGDLAYAVVEADEGGYVVLGRSASFAQGAAYLIKVDGLGHLQWARIFPGKLLWSLETTDAGYALAGLEFGRRIGATLVGVDKEGGVVWEGLSPLRGHVESFAAMSRTRDGGFILGGGSVRPTDPNERAYVVRTDQEGRFIWEGLLPGSKRAFSVLETTDGGYVVAGEAFGDPISGKDTFIAKLRDPPGFVRGKINGDALIDMADSIFLLNFLFLGADPPLCLDAADVDDSGELGITDAILLFTHLFLSAGSLAAPHPEPGFDPTEDELGCLFELVPMRSSG